MKSKLTLCIQDDVKARAKAIAAERGTSLSHLVETYLQLLAEGELDDASTTSASASGTTDDSTDPPDLSPRIQGLQDALGQPAPSVTPDADTKKWVDHAVQKHA